MSVHADAIAKQGSTGDWAGGIHRNDPHAEFALPQLGGVGADQGGFPRPGRPGDAHHEGPAEMRTNAPKYSGRRIGLVLNHGDRAGEGSPVTVDQLRYEGGVSSLRSTLMQSRYHERVTETQFLAHARDDLAMGCPCIGRFDHVVIDVVARAVRGCSQSVQRVSHRALRTIGLEGFQTLELGFDLGRVGTFQRLRPRCVVVLHVGVDTDDLLGAAVDLRLERRRRLTDHTLNQALLHGREHATGIVDLGDDGTRSRLPSDW